MAIPVCAVQVVTQDIMSSLVTVEDLIVKHLYVQNVTGAYGLNDTMFGSVSALQSIDFSTKLFTGQVFVKNILVSEVKGIDARGKMRCACIQIQVINVFMILWL